MITRFAGLYLREDDPDTLVVTSYFSWFDFEKKLQLNSGDILYTDKKTSKTIVVDKNSKVLITINQVSPRGENTHSEIYIKNGEEIRLVISFYAFEEVNDLRKTECYKLVEYIADRLKNKYGIEWEYKISVDTPETEKRFNLAMAVMILIWILSFTLIYWRAKHP